MFSGLTDGLSEDAEEQALSLAGQYLEGGVSRFDAVNALMMDGVSREQAEDIVDYTYSNVSSAGVSELLSAGDRAIMSAGGFSGKLRDRAIIDLEKASGWGEMNVKALVLAFQNKFGVPVDARMQGDVIAFSVDGRVFLQLGFANTTISVVFLRDGVEVSDTFCSLSAVLEAVNELRN